MGQVTLEIAGMSCGHCVMAVQDALAGVDGVRVENVSVGKAVVSVDDGVRLGALIDAVQDAGYEATEAT